MTSTLQTPVATLTLIRTLSPRAIAIELRDEAGRPLYTEEIAIRSTEGATTEPADPEQGA